MATIDQLNSLRRKQEEVLKQVETDELPVEAAIAVTQGILDGVYLSSLYPMPDWYVQPERQVERVSEFLKRYGMGTGFTPADIPSAPRDFVPRTPTEVLLLTVFLPDKARSAQRTFGAWWSFAVPPSGYTKVFWNRLKRDSSNLHYLQSVKHTAGIHWVAFDPNANRGKSPQSCWSNANVAPTLAGPEILMALALFPKWPASWDGDDLPYPNIAGYQLKWENDWRHCPDIGRWDDSHQLGLGVRGSDYANDCWANPSVRVV